MAVSTFPLFISSSLWGSLAPHTLCAECHCFLPGLAPAGPCARFQNASVLPTETSNHVTCPLPPEDTGEHFPPTSSSATAGSSCSVSRRGSEGSPSANGEVGSPAVYLCSSSHNPAFLSMSEIAIPPPSPLRIALPSSGRGKLSEMGGLRLSASPALCPAVIASAFSCPPPV